MLFEARESDLLEKLEHSRCSDLVSNHEKLNDGSLSFLVRGQDLKRHR
jgi:hypothetical protein